MTNDGGGGGGAPLDIGEEFRAAWTDSAVVRCGLLTTAALLSPAAFFPRTAGR